MIVIPPSSRLENYFRQLAESSWEISIQKNPEACESIKSEDTTIVLGSKITQEDGTIISFNLHYRYFKKSLYCFIEELNDSMA